MEHRTYIVKTFLLCKHITLNSTELIKHLCQVQQAYRWLYEQGFWQSARVRSRTIALGARFGEWGIGPCNL